MPEFTDLPDPDAKLYRRHATTSRRLGVEPAPREQVRALVGECNRRLVDGGNSATSMR